MSKHHCPHGGKREATYNVGTATDHAVCVMVYDCGERGWLCHTCREDRADARFDRLTEALALAGLLASMPEDSDRWIDRWEESVALCARQAAATLRAERMKGDGDG